MVEPIFRAEFPSDFEAMAATMHAALEVLLGAGCILKEEEPCVRLCMEEGMVNAIRHGNQFDAARRVRIEIYREGEGCRIKVYDDGLGFSPEDVELPCADQLGGRGICIIRHYMEDVRYDQESNCLEMTFCHKACCEGE